MERAVPGRRGVPFREAHEAVGGLVRSLEEAPIETLSAAHPALADLPRGLLRPAGSVANKVSPGSTSPASVEAQLQTAWALFEDLPPT
ncbi:MAG: hypothetical protein M3N18_09845 [Actinomycetota bacterium]|nr:hypothetical protein [Actinomycetota bacterium]